MQALPDDGATQALVQGGLNHLGWGVSRHMMADIFDAIMANTRATGNWGKGKAPNMPMWPRPQVRRNSVRAKSVSDLYAKFNGKA